MGKFYRIVIEDEFKKRNELFLGQIYGVARVMYKMKIIQHFNIFRRKLGIQSMTVETDESTWRAFCETIENEYPGDCNFNMPVDKELIELFGDKG